jgi:hypothetical protein
MKKIVVLMLLTALTSSLYAQNRKCTTPLPNQQFTQKFNQIKVRNPESSKLQFAKQVVKSFCFSSAQIQEIASLFENDYDRLEFAKVAYLNVTDKENFYDVYDAFIYYSTVFRLHDFIQNKETPDQINTAVIDIEFPNYNYPSYNQYRGKRNCNRVISKDVFNTIASEILALSNEKQKYYKALDKIKSSCVSTEHLMKIASLIKSEDLTLQFAKEAIHSVYDIDQYIEMKQVFSTPRARSEFVSFLGNQSNVSDERSNGGGTASSTSCRVSTEEHRTIITTIKNEKFNSNKMSVAKHLIQTNKCFTALQIKGIVELFDYENSKLEIAKFAYAFSVNQRSYYTTVSESFGFESSKKKLLDYINNETR